MSHLDVNSIEDNFPFEHMREGQKEAITFILESFNSGKDIVIMEAPTGSGKSPIGITIANYFEQSYYITVQKILQSQIIKDFANHGVVDLRGRMNYPCTFYERHGQELVSRGVLSLDKLHKLEKEHPNCTSGFCRKHQKKFKCEWCFVTKELESGKKWGVLKSLPDGATYSACPYYDRLYACQAAKISLFNFASFLYQTQYTSGRFNPRELLIVDECHNLEPELLSFVEISLNDKLLQEYGYKLPEYDDAREYYLNFHDNALHDVVGNVIATAKEEDNVKLEDEYTSILHKLNEFNKAMTRGDEWVVEFKDYGDFRSVLIKPIFINTMTNDLIFKYGSKILLMSATILNIDVFCNSLGVDRSRVAAYRMKNRFPVENRPIHVRSVCKVVGGQAGQKEWGPKLLKGIDEVIDLHPDEKGIIHTHNFNIARMLVTESKHQKRMLYQVNFNNNKDAMLKAHAASQNSIIVAPAMHEGLDLRGDLSRFQILAKVPFPNFFDDKQLARRIDLDPDYYDWLVALKLVQSYGRSIRTDTDYAATYVMDEVFERFIINKRHMLPKWFLEAIVKD